MGKKDNPQPEPPYVNEIKTQLATHVKEFIQDYIESATDGEYCNVCVKITKAEYDLLKAVCESKGKDVTKTVRHAIYDLAVDFDYVSTQQYYGDQTAFNTTAIIMAKMRGDL